MKYLLLLVLLAIPSLAKAEDCLSIKTAAAISFAEEGFSLAYISPMLNKSNITIGTGLFYINESTGKFKILVTVTHSKPIHQSLAKYVYRQGTCNDGTKFNDYYLINPPPDELSI